ncbi:facilitated trehalose transporter Tret1-like [Schistocerca serialis cubense]|uniref:facilitated trehalose transporter Tret1-like n=1 Tax=Schistocerca serialis cubense TaxID=2023355 RepID=UPI00214F019E|nr:facilitated trehalose transporter Tret1-like [Schistocerca serialis cubense]
MKQLVSDVVDSNALSGAFATAASAAPAAIEAAIQRKAEETSRAEAKYSTWPQFLAAFVVNLNTFAYGAGVGWTTMALPQLQSAEAGLRDPPLTTDEVSWVSSLQPIAALVFTPLYCGLTARIGRKALGYLTIAPLMLTWILKIASSSTIVLYVARVAAGANAAGSLVLPSIYVSEIASDDVRGALGSFLALAGNSGILFAYIVGAYLTYDVVLYVCLLLVALYVVTYFFMPETPFWLMSARKYEDAKKECILVSHSTALYLTKNFWKTHQPRQTIATSFTDCVTQPGDFAYAGSGTGFFESQAHGAAVGGRLCSAVSLIGISLVIVVAINQQMGGLFAVVNYAVFIFQASGSSLSPELAAIVIGLLQVAGGVASAPLMDRLGRRVILLLSNVCVGVSVAVLGVYFYLRTETDVDVSLIGWLPVTCLSVYLLMMAFGLGPLPYILLSEIVAPRVRGVASVLAFSAIWGSAALMTKLYPLMSEAMGVHGTFWFFAAICLACSIIGLSTLPETKGRPLEDILRDLKGGKETVDTVS